MGCKFSQLEPEMTVYYLAKILGLAPITLKNGRFHQARLPGKLYPIILAVTYALVLPIPMFLDWKIGDHVMPKNLKLDGIVFTLQPLITYVALVFIPILLVSIGEKIVRVLNDLCEMKIQLESLGIVESLGEYRRNILTSVMTGTTLIGAVHVLMNIFYPGLSVAARITLIVKDLTNLGTVLIFSQILICIRKRFALLDKKLSTIFEDPVRKGLSHLEQLENIKILHFELCDLVNKTTELFSAPILLCIFQYTLLLITCTYWAFGRFLHDSDQVEEIPIQFFGQRIISSSFTAMIVIGQLFGLLHVCATTCDQGKEIGVTLFEVRIKYETPELRNMFLAFATQVIQKRVTVSAFGFFNLDYTCLLQTFGAVLAYLVVMIQFEEE